MKIADLKYKVALCSMNDVVTEGGIMLLSRSVVSWQWAEVRSASASFLARQSGYSVIDSQTNQTHFITIRANSGLVISSAAWVYEQRRKSEPRWYKILGFIEQESWLLLPCHLVEKSDTASPPRVPPSRRLEPLPSESLT